MKSRELTIEGMSCNHCVMHVKKELSKISGLVIEDVQIGRALVQYDESLVPQQRIAQAIDDAGYKLIANN
ncbi:MAG TPA: heavy-metal-associated domain-containing protein [Bacteroidota bacterium]